MMYEDPIRDLLGKVSSGEVPVDAAVEQLRSLPFTDLGFAKVDHHRELRQGFAEVVFCERKTPEQASQIARALLDKNEGNLLLTRADMDIYEMVRELDERAVYYPESKAITIERDPAERKGLVSIVSAGTSDMSVAEE